MFAFSGRSSFCTFDAEADGSLPALRLGMLPVKLEVMKMVSGYSMCAILGSICITIHEASTHLINVSKRNEMDAWVRIMRALRTVSKVTFLGFD